MALVRETEAVSRRIHSSSSAKCFYHIFDHPLCTNGYFDSVLNKKALDLSQLDLPTTINDYELDPRQSVSSKDGYVGEYVKRLIPPGLSDVVVAVDKGLDVFQHLRPFLESVENQPDVVLLKDGLPLLIVEVQSGLFRHSVSKTVVGVIDQFRLLRNFRPDIHHCIGFTFPEYKEKECVAKVHIEWKDLSFHINYTPLTSAVDVLHEVSQAITESLNAITNRLACDHRFFIRLSNAELKLVSRSIHEDIKCQVPSRHSIVLQGKNHFWKYNPNTDEREKIFGYFIDRETLLVRKVGRLRFFGVESYECPLSRQEARCCLYSLVKEVIPVIEHNHGENVAHLDVRLENICFKAPHTVVMIDFDRHMDADKPASLSLTYEGSVMYEAHEGWVCGNLDWKQLGLMILWVIRSDNYDYHHADFKNEQDAFLKGLLFEGQFKVTYLYPLKELKSICIHLAVNVSQPFSEQFQNCKCSVLPLKHIPALRGRPMPFT